MRKFKKKPELSFIVVPGLGRIQDDRILEGDQYAKFCPSVLVELLTEPVAAPPSVLIPPPPPPPAPVSPPIVETKPEAAKAPEVPEEEVVETFIDIPPGHPTPPFMKNDAFPTPDELVAAVDAENKQTAAQIEQAVERLAPMDEEPPEAKDEKPEKPVEEKKAPKAHSHKASGKKPHRK